MVFNLFKKKKDKKVDKYTRLTIKEIRKETDEAISIVFEDPGEGFSYKPGQFITIILDVNGKEERRSYSLCTSPYYEDNPAVTIKKVHEGKVSNFVLENLSPGDEIKVMHPMGNFTTDFDEGTARDIVIFGAGSGITPLMSILKSVLHNEPKSRVFLIYSNRHEKAIIFKEELDSLKAQYRDHLHLYHVLTQPSDGWDGMTGRLNNAVIKEILNDLPAFEPQKADYFLCGPGGFMEIVESTLGEFQVSKNNINKESFVASSKEENVVSEGSENIVDRDVTIVLDGEEHVVHVPVKKSILESGLDSDLDMPFSCQSGLCTACRGRLVSGQVYMEEDDGLSEEEIENGYVLCCVGHPVTDDVKIEIG